ncbi:hypothetical protein [Priestia aryabhattai]
MFNVLKKLFTSSRNDKYDNSYISVSENEMNSQLRTKIIELENLGKIYSDELQKEYAKRFKESGMGNLKVWLHRDIDGDEIEILTSERFFEKEYRSMVAINFNSNDNGNDFVTYLQLWYYFGGYKKGEGTLYNTSERDLKMDIEKILKVILSKEYST